MFKSCVYIVTDSTDDSLTSIHGLRTYISV